MTLLAPVPPSPITKETGIENNIEIELVEALKVLDPARTLAQQYLLRTWSRQTEAITNALDQLKTKPK